jgi:hypothetical protein
MCLLFILQVIYEYGEQRWNDIDRGKPKKLNKNLSQYYCVHHKSHMDWRALKGLSHDPALFNGFYR